MATTKFYIDRLGNKIHNPEPLRFHHYTERDCLHKSKFIGSEFFEHFPNMTDVLRLVKGCQRSGSYSAGLEQAQINMQLRQLIITNTSELAIF